jgi:hypothetical protein
MVKIEPMVCGYLDKTALQNGIAGDSVTARLPANNSALIVLQMTSA